MKVEGKDAHKGQTSVGGMGQGRTGGMGGSYHSSSDESFPLLVPHQSDLRLQLLPDVAIQVLLQVLWEAERKMSRKKVRE